MNMGLVGRSAECGRLAALLESVRGGRGSSLIVLGEPGIGKTALLDHLAAAATDLRVLRVSGVETESGLAYAGLHALAWPLRERVDDLPAPLARALRIVFAPHEDAAVDPLMVCLATLHLLATASEADPLLCIVDDAHWLDGGSVTALRFAARRLLAERVGLVFAARHVPEFATEGLPELVVGGLDLEAGLELLARHSDVSGGVARELVRETAGNPLALIELPAMLTEAQRRGGAPLGQQLTVSERVERAFLHQARSLTAESRLALLICALGDSGELDVLTRALSAARIGLEALDAALGLVHVRDTTLTFRHPLVRSAIVASAGPGHRRRAHLALAEAFDGTGQPDRRAWHLASAATGPDEEVAAALARSAQQMRRRGGQGAEARAFERAARLAPDPSVRAERLWLAAGAWIRAGLTEYGRTLAEEALTLTADLRVTAAACATLAEVAFQRGERVLIPQDLIHQAMRAAEEDRLAVAKAVSYTMNNALIRWDPVEALRICQQVTELTSVDGPHPRWPKGAVRRAAAHVLNGDREGLDRALACVEACERQPADGSAAELAEVLTWLEDYPRATRLLEREIRTARELGDLSLLAYALTRLAATRLRLGEPARARAAAAEALRIAAGAGRKLQQAHVLCQLALAEAVLGDRAACAAYAERALGMTSDRFLDVEAKARYALGLGALAAGDAAGALADLERAETLPRDGGVREPNVVPAGPELVEAYVRVSRRPEALAVLRRLEGAAELTGRRAARAALARCHGLLADEHGFKEAFESALALQDTALDRARTQFLYGQRLRRHRRRGEAGRQLKQALSTFDEARAAGWSRQCRTELAALGHRLSPPGPATALTPQEREVAAASAEGLTNQEIAMRMFLSPKTVDYHLGKVYRKLGIRSRTELARRLADGYNR